MAGRGQGVGDGRAGDHTAVHVQRNVAQLAVERHLEVAGWVVAAAGAEGLVVSADGNDELSLVHGDGDDVDGVDGAVRGVQAARLTPDGAAVGSGAGGRGAVPSHGLVGRGLGEGAGALLVSLDEVGQDGAEGGVVEALDVATGTGDDLLGGEVADVARLAEVVPGDDLDEVGEEVDGLLPAVVPQGVAAEEPVLVVLGEVCHPSLDKSRGLCRESEHTGVEPRADTHHVGLVTEDVHVHDVLAGVLGELASSGPGLPGN